MNRQVPKRYCLIGDGKVARHMAHYFDLLDINYTRWFRSDKQAPLPQLKQALLGCDHVLVLISDRQIESFIQKTVELKGHNLIHFSGALSTPLAASCHPLMTFNQGTYDLARYQSIPFVHQPDLDFKAIFPQLSNPRHVLKAADQSLYHAYCVMAGNFSQMLWWALGNKMQDLGLAENILHPYLLQNTSNFIDSPETATTGPLERGDEPTLKKHINALEDDELKGIYMSYLAWQNSTNTNNEQAAI